MVGADIDRGERALEALDRAKFPISAALWWRRNNEAFWELVIATPRYYERNAPLQLVKALDGHVRSVDLPIRLESNRTPFVRALRKRYGHETDIVGMHLGPETIGDRFVYDAYVYRIK